jgi:hypothetical protein
MRDVPGLDANASPFERLRKFAEMIVSIPKTEADMEIMSEIEGRTKRKSRRNEVAVTEKAKTNETEKGTRDKSSQNIQMPAGPGR